MKITIAGCGNMGLIYARAFLKYEIVSKETLLLIEKDEQRKRDLHNSGIGRVVVTDDVEIGSSDIIILAVKPQDFTSIAEPLKTHLNPSITVLSIMAGVTIDHISGALNHMNVIRAMPNSPAETGMGITAYTAKENIPHLHVRRAEHLLSTTGRSVFLEKEELMNAVTALSGSGPAYFFYIVKNMIEAGKRMGMEDAVASLLVKQTMLGAFHLLNNANKSIDEMIRTVASKGGTTEAALSVFESEGTGDEIIKAILAAEHRAEELANALKKVK